MDVEHLRLLKKQLAEQSDAALSFLDGTLGLDQSVIKQFTEVLSPPRANKNSGQNLASCDLGIILQPCAVCGSADDVDSCLLCDACDLAVHYSCLGLQIIPEGDWSCPWCVKGSVLSSEQVDLYAHHAKA